jgi:hypothetical protein
MRKPTRIEQPARTMASSLVAGTPPLTAETASALAIRAVCSDLEYWATRASTPDGRVGLNDLIQVLDMLRTTTGAMDA